MTANSMRDLLRRAQTDMAFAELARTAPDAAAAEYDLTDKELDSLRRLDWDLYRYMVPSIRADDMSMTAPPTTLTEPMHLTYHTGPVQESGVSEREAEARRRELVADIAMLSGPERVAKLEELMEYV
ncbi:hypothetical protein [Streptacidiphilus neutrinimicus]|uniref:hypothetical protein n=1 Tax=Streptacidiphilus neutrinimicus TaxID=105420 RepID=UPI0005A76AA1|nr:hypothetical protein [Streptacidiphilus neutrinimicus]